MPRPDKRELGRKDTESSQTVPQEVDMQTSSSSTDTSQQTEPLGVMNRPPFKTPTPSPKKDSKAPVHSTPLLPSDNDRGDSDSSLVSTSSTEGRKSGRTRKKTERGAAFDESLRDKKSHKNEDDSSNGACAERSPGVTSSVSDPPKKRGRPRKSETTHDDKEQEEKDKNMSNADRTEEKSVADEAHAEPSSDVSVSVSSQPRKRGRPRKSDRAGNDKKQAEKGRSMSSAQHTGQKRVADPSDEVHADPSSDVSVSGSNLCGKRGRPRKSETSSHDREPKENAESDSGNTQSSGERGLVDAADGTSAVPSPVVPANVSSLPRKRGRPRKSEPILMNRETKEKGESLRASCTGDQTVADVPVSISSPSRRTGHSRKSETMGDDSEPKENGENSFNISSRVEATSYMETSVDGGGTDFTEVQEAPKRKRGRPRKQKPVAEDSSEVLEVSQKTEKEVGGKRSPRKRQRKAVLFYNEDAEEDNEWEGAKRRKRTQKTAADMEYGGDWEEEKEERVVKKKTGPKLKPKDTELTAEELASTTIEACLRCGEKMDNLGVYKNHLISKHAALYRKDCPEGDQSHAALQQILKTHKAVKCPKCRKKFRFAQYFRHHLEWCGREELRVKCEVCGHMVKAMWMQQHQREHRRKEVEKEDLRKLETIPGEKRKAATASIEKIRAAVEELNPFDGSSKKRRGKKADKDWNGQGLEEDDDDDDDDDDTDSDSDVGRSHSGHYNRAFDKAPDYFQEHQDFLDKLPKGNLFTSLLPQRAEWIPLSESESAQYLPTIRESVSVCVKRGRGNPTEPKKLLWGEAISDDKQTTAFVGGPVWSVEWCPLEEELGAQRQVVAVSAGREPWERWVYNEMGEGPGHIQFWTTGCLDGGRWEVSQGLKPAFSIAHDYRHVLDMAWCPRRVYLPAQPENPDAFPRLGLLAVAGYHGHVAVYSIPTPEAVEGIVTEREGKKMTTPPTFKPAPAFTLLCSDPEMAGACLSVAWQKRDNCAFIAGGYTKGFVELWHLSIMSPIVRRSPNTLSSVRFFYAHYGVRSVDWSWLDPSQFVTGGIENQIKVWDTKDTRQPLVTHPTVMVHEKGPTSRVYYGSSVLDAVVYSDIQRDVNSGGVYALDLSRGFFHGMNVKRFQHTLVKHAATVWDMSCSPWYNVVASGDTTGLMYLSTCHHVLFPNTKGATKKRRGLPVFFTRCKQILDGQDPGIDTDQDGTKESFLEDEIKSAEGLHIMFHDRHMEGKKDLLEMGNEKAPCRTDIGGFKAADIHATAFNPNRACSRWLACGTRAGFLRILHLPCLAHEAPSAKKFFKQ